MASRHLVDGNDRRIVEENAIRRARGLETRPEYEYSTEEAYDIDLLGDVQKVMLITIAPGDDGVQIATNMRGTLGMITDLDEAISLYFSFLCLQLKNHKDIFKNSLRRVGIELVDIPWQNSNWANELALDYKRMDMRKAAVAIGQLILLPFKNVSEVNYDQFIKRRTEALCSKVGLHKEDMGAPMKKELAIKLHVFLNGLRDFKIALIDITTEAKMIKTAGINQVLGYVADILSWTDLVAFVLIRDELVRTRSPLTKVTTLFPEWENYFYAIKTLEKYKLPQFFAILADPRDEPCTRRNNFPHLASVALLLARTGTDTARQIVGITGQSNALIDQYLKIHNSKADDKQARVLASMITQAPRLVSDRVLMEQEDLDYMDFHESQLDGMTEERSKRRRLLLNGNRSEQRGEN